MKRMLFNATQAEESRVAIVDGQKLINLDIETPGREQRKGNIYKGIITKVEPSLEACFVDYGTDRHGFLPFKEIHRSYFQNYRGSRPKVQDVIDEGTGVLVQVEKDERGNKGAALTTYISLAGRYLVLMPNNPKGGGVSRRIEGEARSEVKNLINQLNIPKGMSVIARTAGIGRSLEELQWDLDYQLKLWNAVLEASRQNNIQSLILQESALVIRAIRDYFQPDIGEILIDNQEVFDKVYQFISFVMPQSINKVKLYQDHIPLFSRFQIESQIDSVYARQVSLPSGGEIVIDYTEALVSVDVNSAKATKGMDVEETAFQTNLEAAEEISRQMRLRDIGGLVVIDFIDMEDPQHQREVENAIREFLKEDRARIQTTKLSRFGLMEISRQRLQVSLGESTHMTCPRCHGTGVIRGVQSSAIHILRIIQEKAMKDNTGEIQAQLPIDVATFLLNEKREQIFSLEERLGIPIIIIPNKYFEIPHYEVERIRVDDVVEGTPSYSMVEQPVDDAYSLKNKRNEQQQAAVQGIKPTEPAPKHLKMKKSIFAGFTSWLSRLFESEEEKTNSETNGKTQTNQYYNKQYRPTGRRRRTAVNRSRDNQNTYHHENKRVAKKENLNFIGEEVKDVVESNFDDENPNHHSENANNEKRNNTKLSIKENKFDNHIKEKNKTKNIVKKENETENINQTEIKNETKKLKNKENIIAIDTIKSTIDVENNNITEKKENSKNTKKSHRYRIPSASYLENRINLDKISRHIRRITNNVLKDERTLLGNSNYLVEEKDKLLDLVISDISLNKKETQIVFHFLEESKNVLKEAHSALNGGDLLMVETNQALMRKDTDDSDQSEYFNHSNKTVIRRNDIQKELEKEEPALELQQIETRQAE